MSKCPIHIIFGPSCEHAKIREISSSKNMTSQKIGSWSEIQTWYYGSSCRDTLVVESLSPAEILWP